MTSQKRIVLTGFMGVGKTTIARCLSHILRTERIDLDRFIEAGETRKVSEIIENDGLEKFRELETANLEKLLTGTEAPIIALGGGTWTIEINRQMIKNHGCTTVWLESTFEHCWRNLLASKQDRRPLASNRDFTKALFEERQKYYCLADWHFIVEPQLTSLEIARRIANEVMN